ncbi:hypothetical protein PR003_g23071 [Phytophthora rubi]|uniref:Reverse transcriptase domain-containing protein n=1 Tax=Phytophthora rubi TaxID=129364 RepID=A0A6A4D2Y0_9STRA|nr:hypothetical protein PR003_g23071 [Phytophthora rubi]
MVKRWLYQQNLRPDTSSHISQNIPLTLLETIDHAQRFEDARKPSKFRQNQPQNHNQKVRPRHLRRLLRECDNEFCFFVNPSDEPSKADLAWEKLKTSPAYPLVIKFHDKVFRSHLPAISPTRQAGTDAKIELEDDVPIHRKQFPVSAEQRGAIRAWTAKMLTAKMIRPSTSPYCAPTFCVKKRTGEWRIVHDFRGLNTKIRVPLNPIPRKDDILRAMAKGKLFSAMDLLWGFFQVKLVEASSST